MKAATKQAIVLVAGSAAAMAACVVALGLGAAFGSDEPDIGRPFVIGSMILGASAVVLCALGAARLLGRERNVPRE